MLIWICETSLSDRFIKSFRFLTESRGVLSGWGWWGSDGMGGRGFGEDVDGEMFLWWFGWMEWRDEKFSWFRMMEKVFWSNWEEFQKIFEKYKKFDRARYLCIAFY